MSETRWWWVRHAPVTANKGCIYGQTDWPCETGDAPTFQRLAKLLPKDAVWVTSNLLRTKQTAAAIHAALPPPPPEPEEHADLAEQHFGDWQGRTYEEVRRGDLGYWHKFWLAPASARPPGGESFMDLMARVGPVVEQLSERYRGRDIVAVTHGGTIRAALAQALHLTPEKALAMEVENCSLTRLDLFEGPVGSHAPDERHHWSLRFANLSPKLMASLATTEKGDET